MMDDPGLGWHLRIADAMWEHGGFVFSEQFCFTSEGAPWITKAWLADILMRLAYAWADLDGVAALTSIVVALTVRTLYTQQRKQGIHWSIAVLFGFIASVGMAPASPARPNVFTLLGVALVTCIVLNFHEGRIDRSKTWLLLPIFVLWPNLHGGYLAGILILCLSYVAELALCLFSNQQLLREAAWKRFLWWTYLAPLIFICTLLNPNTWNLHVWTLNMLTDPFLQNQTTVEWRPPDFKNGWGAIEIIILMFPALASVGRYRPHFVSLTLCIAWLHFALTSARYTPLWVIIAIPTMAMFFSSSPIASLVAKFIQKFFSDQMWQRLAGDDRDDSWWWTAAIAMTLFLITPLIGPVAQISTANMPKAGLNHLLEVTHGERVFHSINWGGYLTLYGWSQSPHFQTFIDDRIDVHGEILTKDYFEILAAGDRWKELLEQHQVRWLCLPDDAPLTSVVKNDPAWAQEYNDPDLTILKKVESNVR